MKCTFCGYLESKVSDSRPSEDGSRIRRRRECLSCGARFTTYEIVETIPLMVIKKDNTRQPFNSQKLVTAILRACGKRPVSVETIENLVSEIEYNFSNLMAKEIKSTEIAELVMQKLKSIDQVAYVRFASVYKEFSDIDEFMIELKTLKKFK
ncbi:MAG: transcriptional regulator NrdR [Oscillospiraceae bacterium]